MKFEKFRNSKVPVVILGEGLTALGVLRCFGRAGIPVYCVSDDLGILVWSRFFRRMRANPKSVSHPNQLASLLERLPFERCVLVPCADNWASAVAALPNEFAERYPTSQASAETLRLLVDKGGFADLLVKLRVPHPKTFVINSAEQLGSLDVADFAGSFLKPRDSQAFFTFYEAKACRVKSREDAVWRFERIQDDGFEVLFQEYVPGPASNHYFIDGFVDSTGQVCALFARRRLRMYPTDFGNSSYMISIPIEDVSSAAENLKRLLQEISYRGIFSAEFKFDERDRQFKILEINARPWWFVEFAAQCGVDVCKLAYRDALGERVRPVRSYRTGVRSVHPYFDIHACLKLRSEGKLGVLSCIKSWVGAKYPVLCFDDPLPAYYWWLKKVWFKLIGHSS